MAANPLWERLSDTSDTLNRGDEREAKTMRSKEEQERIVKRALSEEPTETEFVDLSEGAIVAVEICSTVLQAHIWLAFEADFRAPDEQPVYYGDELEFLKTKTPEQLREIHKVKVAFGPGSRVRQ
jgi:hypothetical protein